MSSTTAGSRTWFQMSNIDKSAVVAEARTWIGTPYHTHQRLKGVGVDCAQFVAGVAEGVGIREKVVTPMDYSNEWNIHNREEVMLHLIEDLGCYRIENPVAGDIVCFQIGRAHGHMGILSSKDTFIHAFLKPDMRGSVNGVVEENYFTGDWAKFPKIYYSYPEA